MENIERPPIRQLLAYREKVKKVVIKAISSIGLDDNSIIQDTSPFWIIIMAIEYEKMHLEKTSVLIRQLPLVYIKQTTDGNIFRNTFPTSSQNDNASTPTFI